MKYDKIGIDISNFYTRAFSIGQEMKVKKSDDTEIITGGIYITLKMLRKIEKEFLKPGGQIYFLFDNCHSGINKRKEIDPDYKSNRSKRDDAYYESLDLLQLLLLNYKDNYFMVKKDGLEADDLVEPFTSLYSEDLILLISNDMDWFRSISKRVNVAKYEKGKYNVYDNDKFEEKFGFKASRENVCLYKSFKGDKGDNVPNGVPGLRTSCLNKLIENYTTLNEIFLDIDVIPYISDTFKKKIKSNRSRLLMNYKLVDYLTITNEELEETIIQAKFNAKTLLNMYKSFKFNIRETDPRLLQYHMESNTNRKSFFKTAKIPRG